MHFVLNFLFYVAPFLVVIGLVITVHEFGHFLAGKWLGAKIDQFSIGFFGPLAHWRDKDDVEWRIGWLPIGGFVRFAGDDNAASIPDQDNLDILRADLIAREGVGALDKYHHFKPLWQRAVISAAGPAANFILAIVIFSSMLIAFGDATIPPRVDTVKPGGPAAIAGFHPGDLILKADGRKVTSFGDLQGIVFLKTGTPIPFVVERDGKELALTATPVRGVIVDRLGHEQHLGLIGLGYVQRPGDLKIKHYGPIEGVAGGVDRTWEVVRTTLAYIGRLATGRETAEQLSGPLGMAQMSGDITKQSAIGAHSLAATVGNVSINLLQLAATISVGIGFLNLLPVPVLDGGHLLFYAFEAVARRPLAAKVQAAGYRVGLALVLGLMLFATWNDLQRLHVFKLFGRLFS